MITIQDIITCFTGGVGAGKTFCAEKAGSKDYSRVLLGYCIRKPFLKLFKRPPELIPLYLTNIPVKLKMLHRAIWWLTGNGIQTFSAKLKAEHLLLQEHIPEQSVILVDEFSATLTQFDFRSPNVDVLDEFFRWCRHYFNGSIIITDQCSENIVLQVRRRFNLVHNCLRLQAFPFGRSKIFGKLNLFAIEKYRLVYISEEIKDVGQADQKGSETESQEIGIRWAFYWFPYLFPKYKTRAFRHRYDSVPAGVVEHYDTHYTNKIIKIPGDRKIIPKTTSKDDGLSS